MKYMLLTYMDEQSWLKLSPGEQREAMEACGPHVQKLIEKRKLLAGAPLQPTSTATTLRVRGGKRLTTDGPFAETREQLGGYTIVDAENLDEALEIAWGFLTANDQKVSIEVRPIVDLGGSVPSYA